jgi:phosphohistidine phosphatase
VHEYTSARIDFKKGGVAGLRTSGELIVLLRPRELEAIAD